MNKFEPHSKHVSDATQLTQDRLDKGSPTAGPSGGHRAPALAHQTHVSTSSFKGLIFFKLSGRPDFTGPSQIRPSHGCCCRMEWNAMERERIEGVVSP